MEENEIAMIDETEELDDKGSEIEAEEIFDEENADDVTLDLETELASITEELPELKAGIDDLAENERYSELRALGLTPTEAYLATRTVRRAEDNRSHLTRAVPRSATAPRDTMSRQQLNMARSIFEGLDDSEIRRLYKKVTK